MKKFVFAAALSLMACTSQNSDPVAAPKVEAQAEKEELFVQEVTEQVIVVQDVNIEVSRAIIESNISGTWAVFLIKTPKQKLSFGMSYEKSGLKEDLSPEMIATVEASLEGHSQKFDITVESKIEEFAVMNVLAFDRCRTVSVVPKLIETLSKPRTTIYFGMFVGEYSDFNYALRWNMQKKEFTGLVKTDDWYSPGSNTLSNETLLLTANSNLANEEGLVFEDSAFISIDSFNYECDSKYNVFEKQKPFSQRDPNDNYVPEYDAQTDSQNSSFVETWVETVRNPYDMPSTSHGSPDYSKLKKELIQKAKSNPLFLKFTQGLYL